jgi:hypothetical protein
MRYGHRGSLERHAFSPYGESPVVRAENGWGHALVLCPPEVLYFARSDTVFDGRGACPRRGARREASPCTARERCERGAGEEHACCNERTDLKLGDLRGSFARHDVVPGLDVTIENVTVNEPRSTSMDA